MKIFISSVISGYEAYRSAAVEAVETLGHEVMRAEDYSARPDSPQQVCLAGVREADVVLLLIGARYGYPQKSGLSATHEEYREARDRCRILAFVQTGVTREDAQEAFLQETQSWNTGQYTANYSHPDELKKLVIKALHQYDLSRAAGPIDEKEMLDRAMKLVDLDRASGISVVVVGGPSQQVLRPSELESSGLADQIIQHALFGSNKIFTRTVGTDTEIVGDALEITQEAGSSVYLDESGAVRIIVPARDAIKKHDFLPVLIEEDITERIAQSLKFAGWMLDTTDPAKRLSDVVTVVGLLGADHMGWQTRAEHQASGNSYQMGMRSGDLKVHLTPARQPRAALSLDSGKLADDFMVRLRRIMRARR